MLVIERVAELNIPSGSAVPFTFVPHQKDKVLKGILYSSQLELSLAFQSGTDVKLNQLPVFHSTGIAPDKRIIQLHHPLKGIIKGIASLPISGTVNVYFIIEKQDSKPTQ